MVFATAISYYGQVVPLAPIPNRDSAWPAWRRRHQARAKACHYRRRQIRWFA